MIGIIFDLDGTLIDSYDLDEQLYTKAVLSEVPGVKLRNSLQDYRYSTDSGILTEILKEHNLPLDPYYESVRRRFGELVKDHLQTGNHCTPIPGAVSLFRNLSEHPGLQIGIATGGWGHSARMKLDAAGLSDLNIPMVSSDEALSRTDIMGICAARMGTSIRRLVYVGDAEWDLHAARELKWDFVGIGRRLKGKCDVWIPDFLDGTPLLALLGS